MTDFVGIKAAWQAAEQLRSVLMLFNASDLSENGSDNRHLGLAYSGEGTGWDAARTALRITLATLLGDHPSLGTKAETRAERVMRGCFDNGESIAYNVGILRETEAYEIIEAFAAQCLPVDY